MKLLISIFSLGLLALAASQTFAAGGASSSPSRGQAYCEANDRGWEEHGSHSSCGECLARHDRCTETCYEKSYSCTAKGTNRDGSSESFEAYSDFSENDARNQALNRCSSRASGCSVSSCNDNSRITSSRGC